MSSIKQYLQFVRPYKWKNFANGPYRNCQIGIPLLLPLILRYVIDNIINADDLTDSAKLEQLFWLMGGAFIIFLVLRPPIEYFRQYLAQWVGNTVLYDIRDKLFDHIQKLSLRFYSQTKPGKLFPG